MVRGARREARFGVSEIDTREDDRGCGRQDDESPVETGAVDGEWDTVPAHVVAVADEQNYGRGEEGGPGDDRDDVKDVAKQFGEVPWGVSRGVGRSARKPILERGIALAVNRGGCRRSLERSR